MSALQDSLERRRIRKELARLAELLALNDLRRRIEEVHVHGRGGRARVVVVLDHGSEIVLDPIGTYLTPAKLAAEMATQAGATPALKGPQVLDVAKLIHDLGEHHQALEIEDRAWQAGAEYLSKAAIGEVDMADQASRWSAFVALMKADVELRHDVVLEDVKTHIRYVRLGWLIEYLRPRVGAGDVDRYLNALGWLGWYRTNSQGKIKATDPVSSRVRVMAFLLVPAGWE